MVLLNIALLLFILLELSNVVALYFKPTFKQANAMGVFKNWDKSKENPEIHNIIQYLVYWVAGTKIIFISLLVVVLFFAEEQTKVYSTIALILSMLIFYWKMFPLIRKMDSNNEIIPKGYSKTLGIMIFTFALVLSGALMFFLRS